MLGTTIAHYKITAKLGQGHSKYTYRLSQNPQKATTIIWLRMGNTNRRVILERIQSVLRNIEDLILSGEKLIEIR